MDVFVAPLGHQSKAIEILVQDFGSGKKKPAYGGFFCVWATDSTTQPLR